MFKKQSGEHQRFTRQLHHLFDNFRILLDNMSMFYTQLYLLFPNLVFESCGTYILMKKKQKKYKILLNHAKEFRDQLAKK